MFYMVKAKCGHVGNKKYIERDFPIFASSKKEAARIVLRKSRVKKHLKDAILCVVKINEKEYDLLIKKNNDDIYLHSHNKLNNNLFIDEVKEYQYTKSRKYEFSCRDERVSFKKKKENLKEEKIYGYVY